MVVKAESEEGRRLHIDKAMLRTWREDFARLMREQGIAANATPSVARGRNKTKTPSAIYRSRQRGASHVVRKRVTEIAEQLSLTGFYEDPSRPKLVETRVAVGHAWKNVADTLDLQGEMALARDVRSFARHLPTVHTDNEKLADRIEKYLGERILKRGRGPEHVLVRTR